jgi:hypothetical protein
MTAVAPLVFPSSRVLAGWWRQLAAHRPSALWVGHLLLHHVETLFAVPHAQRLDRFNLLVLKVLAQEPAPTAASIDRRLHLGRPLVLQLLRGLEGEGLARREAEDLWAPTPLGRQALERGDYAKTSHERRALYFLDSGRPGQAPVYLDLKHASTVPAPVPDGWRFDPGLLEACLRQPPEWKRQHGFPTDVEPAPGVGPEASPEASWRRVVVDRPERQLAALVRVTGDGGAESVLGFAARQEGWALHSAEPAFRLRDEARAALPELAEEPPLDVWQRAWQSWCQPRGLSPAETGACPLERHGYRLRVQATPRVAERLRATRSDALRGDAWLLAGAGRVQTAALVELIEPPS